jgi:hypothetical protein
MGDPRDKYKIGKKPGSNGGNGSGVVYDLKKLTTQLCRTADEAKLELGKKGIELTIKGIIREAEKDMATVCLTKGTRPHSTVVLDITDMIIACEQLKEKLGEDLNRSSVIGRKEKRDQRYGKH